jgi:hypothetical protein
VSGAGHADPAQRSGSTLPRRSTRLPAALNRLGAPLTIAAGAVVLRVLSGVGFANYDTLYALVWGQQAARGETPQYGIPLAPTPHPLVEALGVVTSPLGPRAQERVAVALGFLALSACGWAVYRLGALWFNRPAGALAAVVLVTRVPVLSYGVRAYVDLPYLALVLGALVVETRRPRAGAPVLALLALAGLLRPEAWVFSGGYWGYLFFWSPYGARAWARVRARAKWGLKKEHADASGGPEREHSKPQRGPQREHPAHHIRGPEQEHSEPYVGDPQKEHTEPYIGPPEKEQSEPYIGGPEGERSEPRSEPSRGSPRRADSPPRPAESVRTPRELAWLAVLALAAPVAWVASDWLVTGNAVWSLTNTRHTAEELGRETGIAKVPEYVPRRIGEILGAAGLAGATIGGAMSLVWLRGRAVPGVVVGVVAVAAFAGFATVGLPINTRYAFLAAAIGCVFCGAAVFGWMLLPPGHRGRRWWGAAAVIVAVGLVASIPSQYRTDHHELQALARQQRIQDDLETLVDEGAITAGCEPIGVPNHAPIPLLALRLQAPPAKVVSAQVRIITHGTYVDPANEEVRREYVLNRNDPDESAPANPPPGFKATRTSRDWLIFKRCTSGGG